MASEEFNKLVRDFYDVVVKSEGSQRWPAVAYLLCTIDLKLDAVLELLSSERGEAHE